MTRVIMNQDNFRSHFVENDSGAFVRVVSDYLSAGAHKLRGISAQEYVGRCRREWVNCETDEVFKLKMLIDKLVYQNRSSPFDSLAADRGLELVDLVEEPPEDLYCIALGLVRSDGSFLEAPEGYEDRSRNITSKRAVAVAFTSEIPIEEPEEPAAADYFLALFDVLGFENKLADIGLKQLNELYTKLIRVALEPHAASNLWTPFLASVVKHSFAPGIFWLPMRYTYFSDLVLLWVPYDPQFVQPFLVRCLDVFCEAVKLGIPIRGAISAGELILHKKSGTYLGDALVEAARLEAAQDWLGVSLGASVRSKRLRVPFDPRLTMIHDTPIKAGRSHLVAGLVLDWPRRWREVHGTSVRETIEALRTPGYEKYYDNALRFVEYSDANPEWYLTLADKE